jgi:two-component system LytT family response regulator
VRTLIVDDMPLARQRVRACLARESDVEIVGECANGREAVASINSLRPDLVFLDVQMPQIGGFEVIEAVGVERAPVVIFVTAYDEFALKAFEVSALDYLLKPFDEDRFARAVARARREIELRRAGEPDARLRLLIEQVGTERKYPKRLEVKAGGHSVLVPTEDIDWIGAARNYLELHVGRETHLLRERLGALEARLDPARFVRVHRSSIVNVERIRQLHPLFNGDQELILRDGTRLTSSRTYSRRLKSLLGEL